MTVKTTLPPDDWLDIVTHSPDGESRGLMFRTGDIFPMDPRPHQVSKQDETATEARPWGLRHLVVDEPRAGKHSSDTKKNTTGGGGDNQKPEDWDTD